MTHNVPSYVCEHGLSGFYHAQTNQWIHSKTGLMHNTANMTQTATDLFRSQFERGQMYKGYILIKQT